MPRKHLKRQAKGGKAAVPETSNTDGHEQSVTDDDAASNSTADSFADDDAASSQESEDRVSTQSGIKLVLKMSGGDSGATSEVYSPSSHEDKKRKHKKKKKKKSSDREKYRYYPEQPLVSDNLDSIKEYTITSNTATPDYSNRSDDDDEPLAKRPALDLKYDHITPADNIDNKKDDQQLTFDDSIQESETKVDDSMESDKPAARIGKVRVSTVAAVLDTSDFVSEQDYGSANTEKFDEHKNTDLPKSPGSGDLVAGDVSGCTEKVLNKIEDHPDKLVDAGYIGDDVNDIKGVYQEDNHTPIDNSGKGDEDSYRTIEDTDDSIDDIANKHESDFESEHDVDDNIDDSQNGDDDLDMDVTGKSRYSHDTVKTKKSSLLKASNKDIPSVSGLQVKSFSGKETGDPGDSTEETLEKTEEENKTPGNTCDLPTQQKTVSVLKPLLYHLHNSLTKSDVHGIFAFPVNDLIAPGYSAVITDPMDFSTISTKIKANEYRNVLDMKKDIELMFNNAMAYNHADTIYYKEASRLLQYSNKILSKEKLLKTVRTNSFLASATLNDLGFEDLLQESVVTLQRLSDTEIASNMVSSPDQSSVDTTDADITEDEILTQARAAAKGAADRLTLRKPNSHIGFLKRRKDGTTSFNIINPDNTGIVSDTERVVDIGSLLTKLKAGGTSISGFKEDRRNKVNSVNYLNYGPFSTYAPQYDSSFANISKEDSDLLLSTYKDPIGVNYAQSVMSFVDNAGDYAVKMVNQLLDMLTKGEHSKTQKTIDEHKQLAEEQAAKQMANSLADNQAVDFESLESLSDLGIDTMFLDHFKPVSNDPLQRQLDTNATLLHRLEKSQYARLKQNPPSDLNKVATPTSTELSLANKVINNLTNITTQLRPADVASTRALHKALGISMPHDIMKSSGNKSTEVPKSIETPKSNMTKFNPTHVPSQPITSSETNQISKVQPTTGNIQQQYSSQASLTTQAQESIQAELEKLLDESTSSVCPPLVSANDDNVI